jgi:hypothetical protein
MNANDLLVHCFAERKDGHWQAFCLEFDLAVQGETAAEVEHKLTEQIVDYVRDATIGIDREFGAQLLLRRSPKWLWLKYWAICALTRYAHFRATVRKAYLQPLPLAPQTQGC